MELEPLSPSTPGPAERFTGTVWVTGVAAAIVQTLDGATIIAGPGQTVFTPPGEWHWHGATETGFMEHLAISASLAPEDRATVTWGEHVSDADYRHAHSTDNADEGPQHG